MLDYVHMVRGGASRAGFDRYPAQVLDGGFLTEAITIPANGRSGAFVILQHRKPGGNISGVIVARLGHDAVVATRGASSAAGVVPPKAGTTRPARAR